VSPGTGMFVSVLISRLYPVRLLMLKHIAYRDERRDEDAKETCNYCKEAPEVGLWRNVSVPNLHAHERSTTKNCMGVGITGARP
jgi:hypothetical protein